jgi:hypothetical protein
LFAVFTGGGGSSTSGYGNLLARSPMFINVLGELASVLRR